MKNFLSSTYHQSVTGQVFCLLKNTIQPRSCLQLNIDTLLFHQVILSCSLVFFVALIGIALQRDAMQILYYSLSLTITLIPEGLPIVVGLIMALTVLRLSKQKAIVKSMSSIETLGSLQVLCADKTGTLTRHDMTLTDVVTSDLHSISSSELEELNNEDCKRHMTFNNLGGKMFSIGRLMEVGTLCNNASFDARPVNEPGCSHFVGQPTECAFLDAAVRLGFGDSRTKFDRISEEEFSSNTRRMMVRCQRRDLPGASPMCYVKGAWEEVLRDCTHYYDCGLVKARSDDLWLDYARICTTLGSQGLRVLALATGPEPDQLTFVGIVGINNAPRDGLPLMISKLVHSYGIDFKMITGDSRATALAIGRQLGLVEPATVGEGSDSANSAQAMSGEELDKLLASSESQLSIARQIATKRVFYRVNPRHKADIVGSLQDLEQIVGMMGDGDNDLASLQRSQLAVVMGSGSSKCKDIADMIIVDDELQALDEAILEGRGIYERLQSYLGYQLSLGLSVMLLVAVAFACKLEPPFSIAQVLFFSLLTDGPSALSMGTERCDPRDVRARPHNPSHSLVDLGLLGSLLSVTATLTGLNGTLYYLLLDSQWKLDTRGRSLMFGCFVLSSLFSAICLRSRLGTIFETRTFANKQLLGSCALIVAAHLTIMHVSQLADLFAVEPITAQEYLYLSLYASLLVVIVDLSKVCVRLCMSAKRHLARESGGAKLLEQSPSSASLTIAAATAEARLSRQPSSASRCSSLAAPSPMCAPGAGQRGSPLFRSSTRLSTAPSLASSELAARMLARLSMDCSAVGANIATSGEQLAPPACLSSAASRDNP